MPGDPAVFEVRLHLADAEATRALGCWLGRHLRAGQGLALSGELGAGKTCLARGVGEGLGLDDPAEVCSPTYLLVVEHPGPVPMLHVDAYLPDKTRAFLEDGGLDYLGGCRGVVVVEWAERLPGFLPEPTLWVELRPGGGGSGREAFLVDRVKGAFPWLAQARQFPEVL